MISHASIAPGSEPTIALDYDLLALPCAHHRAGLAGMMMLVSSLRARGRRPLPRIELLQAGRVRVTLARNSLAVLLNELYDAFYTSIDGRAEPLLQPQGRFLEYWLQGGALSPWLKLWRDMLWSTLRARDKTREPYRRRAEAGSEDLADALWEGLMDADATGRGGGSVTSLSSALLIGAEALNGERVAFRARVEHTLLLHFWQVASLFFVPQIIQADGSRRYEGFVVAVPDVQDLRSFPDRMIAVWRGLSPQLAGFRPREALVDLIEEAGLELLHQLRGSGSTDCEGSLGVLAVELYHLQKQGNNIRVRAAERVSPDPRVIATYARIRERCRNPHFKALRIRNLLRGDAWHHGTQPLFAQYPWTQFIYSRETPGFYFFGRDVQQQLNWPEPPSGPLEAHSVADVTQFDDALARRVYRLIGAYVDHMARMRSGLEPPPPDEQGRTPYPPEYQDARQKVAADAFLAMRARRGNEFVQYFASTVFVIPHYLPREEFVAIGQALITEPETVKSLAMLALSAHSWPPASAPRTADDDTSAAQEETR